MGCQNARERRNELRGVGGCTCGDRRSDRRF